jgi:hypothetical protein
MEIFASSSRRLFVEPRTTLGQREFLPKSYSKHFGLSINLELNFRINTHFAVGVAD